MHNDLRLALVPVVVVEELLAAHPSELELRPIFAGLLLWLLLGAVLALAWRSLSGFIASVLADEQAWRRRDAERRAS